MANAMISCLIDEKSRQWNDGLMDGTFSHEEVAIIKKKTFEPNGSKGCFNMASLTGWTISMQIGLLISKG